MPTDCGCCPTVPPGSPCSVVMCRGGTAALPSVLLCTLVFPENPPCCCPNPEGGVVSFPIVFNPAEVSQQGAVNQSPCLPAGLPKPAYTNRTTYNFCVDVGAVPCESTVTPPPYIVNYFFVVLNLCPGSVGIAEFFLSARLATSGGFPAACGGPYDNACPIFIGENPPPCGTFNDCREVVASCQLPDAPFNLGATGYDCGDIYLEFTVTGINPGCQTPCSAWCGPITVIIQTPP